MNPNSELDELSLEDLIQRFRAPAAEPDDALYYGELAVRIQAFGEPGLEFLVAERPAIEHDEDRLRALILGLTYERRDDPTVSGLLLAYVEDSRPLVVMDAIDALRYWRVQDAWEQVNALAQHPSPYVRGGVARYMAGLFPNETETRELLLASLRDESFIVRESAVDAIDDEDIADLLPDVRPLLEDPHPHVRGAARWALMDDDERTSYVDDHENQEADDVEASQDDSA